MTMTLFFQLWALCSLITALSIAVYSKWEGSPINTWKDFDIAIWVFSSFFFPLGIAGLLEAMHVYRRLLSALLSDIRNPWGDIKTLWGKFQNKS